MSWPWARNVLVPVAEEVTLGEVDGLAGAEAGPLGDAAELGAEAGALAGLEAAAAELLEELQAVTSKAAQASDAQAATCRALRAFMVVMDSHPLTENFPITARRVRASHSYDVRRAAMVGSSCGGGETAARSA